MLDLLIFELVLFLNLDNFIDSTTISVLWVVKNQWKDLVIALLADVYYTLHSHHGKMKGLTLWCICLLYSWLASHFYADIYMIKTMNSHHWSQKLVSLMEKSILWYTMKLDIEEITFNCGNFPNVPLIGSIGCINYNIVLALRKLGYPMLKKPDDGALEEFVLHDWGAKNPNMLRRIIGS